MHQIRQLLGLTGYFRHFVQDYAIIAKPLTTLTKKNIPWKWEADEDKAFCKLRDVLVSRPVLSLFNPDSSTELHTDASQIGLAGILMQRGPDERLHPVAYYSRPTTDVERITIPTS